MSLHNGMLSLDAIQRALKDRRLYHVARLSRVSYPVLCKLRKGVTTDYRLRSLQLISKYLMQEAAQIAAHDKAAS